jgi:16S rRNA (guanine527-N7)-methyltransferase
MIALMAMESMETDPAKADFFDACRAACSSLNLSLGDDLIDLMWRHFRLMIETNRHTNLTRIIAPAEAAVKHYVDSLALIPWASGAVTEAVRLLDVGTGAGFPSVPLAICCPGWRVAAVESTRKKADFVARAGTELGLPNLSVRPVRARQLAGHDVPYEVVACRAVDEPLAILKEVRRLVASGGWVVCYTTPRGFDALTEVDLRKIERLGFAAPEAFAYRLESGGEVIERVLAVFQKL